MAGEKRPGFATAPERFLTGRGPGQSRLRPGPAEVICAQGAPDDALFYIEEGWVKISVVSPDGKDAVLALRKADDFFGTRSLIDGHRRAAAATTLTYCSLVRITRAAVIQRTGFHPCTSVSPRTTQLWGASFRSYRVMRHARWHLATDSHPDADFLEILPMTLLLHPAIFALRLLSLCSLERGAQD
jgi:hypothetical protein